MLRRSLTRGVLACLLGAVLALPAIAAEEKKASAPRDPKAAPSATLDVASEQMRLIMGGTAGKGVLHYGGKDYPFTFKSASVGLGAKAVQEMKANGKVYGLNRIEDFAGNYTSISTTTVAGSGKASATYSNDRGVSIDLVGSIKGAGMSLGGGVATIELIKQ
ncbi:MAG: hypothetical protein ACAH21_01880 [Ramlibacter sp.]|nr:hypothetical protein [Ramlibacter sp.]